MASFITDSFSKTSRIALSPQSGSERIAVDSEMVATVSVGAKIDANNKASTGLISIRVPDVHTMIPQAIKKTEPIVPAHENSAEDNQVRRKESILNFKDEWNKIGGNPKNKNISDAKDMDVPPHKDTNMPKTTANTDGGIQFNCFMRGNPITIEINNNSNNNSLPTIS